MALKLGCWAILFFHFSPTLFMSALKRWRLSSSSIWLYLTCCSPPVPDCLDAQFGPQCPPSLFHIGMKWIPALGERPSTAHGAHSFSTFRAPSFRVISLDECPTSHGSSAAVETEGLVVRASPWPSLAGRRPCGCGESPRGRWRASPRCWDSREKTEKQVGNKLQSCLDNQLCLCSHLRSSWLSFAAFKLPDVV